MKRLLVLLLFLPCVSATIIAESQTRSVEMFGTGLQTATASGPSLSATVLTTAFQPGSPNAASGSVSANIGFFGDDYAASPTPTPSPSPSPSPSPIPSSSSPPLPTQSPLPSTFPAATPPTPPMQGSATAPVTFTLTCPQSVLIAPTDAKVTAYAAYANATPVCIDWLEMKEPNGQLSLNEKDSCANGLTNFVLGVTQNGQHDVNATIGSHQARCSFSSLGQPPRAADESNIIFVAAVALLAFVIAGRRRA